MTVIFYKLTLAGYMATIIAFFIYLFSSKHSHKKIAIFLFLVSFSTHTAGFICNWVQLGHFPIITIKSSLCFMAWLLAVIYLILFFRFGLAVLGSFFTPLILVLVFLSQIVPAMTTPPSPAFKGIWLSLHISFSLIGDALLAVAFCGSLIYLLQEKQIKHKRITGTFKLFPSLSFLDTLNYHALILGFVMLTIGLIIGSIYAQWVIGRFWNWDPKEIWSVLTWLVYAILLYKRMVVGWRGRRAAWLAIIGFGCLFFTFLGVNYCLRGYHSFR
jgi:cytochrome c-type biogenesis protein CcsB